MLTILSGGTGSVKLLRGLRKIGIRDATVICNVGDNIWIEGLYVCPDLDTAIYGLAGVLDEEKGWGIRGDTFNFLEQMKMYGRDSWFRIGDRDLATHLVRTALLASGSALSDVTNFFRRRFGLGWRVLPASDRHLETRIVTEFGELHIQEFWVKHRGMTAVKGVVYRDAERAEPSPFVIESIEEADGIILCPANPITSIGPILAVPGIREALKRASAKVVAVSPIVGGCPISGPAGKLMDGVGVEVSALGVAKLYSDFLDVLVIDNVDARLVQRVGELGVKVHVTYIIMRNASDEGRLAEEVVGLMEGSS